ncbi:hypothetical protein [Bacillus swezeyi]|uniref:Uncharacterized protein n=1 Tax=Bacillus swezeyi TaxID=1925020 RepID=A0A5M8REC4_9BACI|nr:hypothetical protein [Bacillus swezeyi]KAA6446925.1 hypothetical protein DX927_23010 [Bacillus swezeyi]KAA6471493.1 hypothetical protein DX928_23250 [Bacillus swezeyi]
MIFNDHTHKEKEACSNEHASFFSNKANAGELIEQFIESGAYKQYKRLECEKKILNKKIHDHLIHHESRRHEIGYNLVAKFIPQKIFKYDYPALNEFLYDRGLLFKLTKLTSSNIKKYPDLLHLFEFYSLSPEFFIKPSFNKLGKELTRVEKSQSLQRLSFESAAKKRRHNMNHLKETEAEYAVLKQRMELCPRIIHEKKIPHKYGSVSLIQKPLVYDNRKLKSKDEIQTLIEFGIPNMDHLKLFVSRGFISENEIDSFRHLEDIKLNFVIMDIDEEAKMRAYLYEKTLRRSII